jgi:rod shape-determining protein MreC
MQNKRYSFLALFTLSICVLALYIHRHRQGQTGKIDSVLIGTLGYFQKHSFYVGRGARALGDHYVFLVNTQKRNEELRNENGALLAKLSSMQEVQLENERLRKGLEFHTQVAEKLVMAHVTAHDISSDYFGIRIDKGTDDGLKVGMGVISPSGVVGRILRVTPAYADVITLLDPDSSIDVIIQRSRARGILSGESKSLLCTMRYVDKLEDVQVNDTVVASGFGNIFPKGLLVGYVTDVKPDTNGILQTVTVKSAVDIYRLEEVFIVLPPAESKKTS